MKSFSLTDVGQVRNQNQDYVYASEQPIGNLPNLFVLADGMGGHNAGDFASRCAVSVIEASVKKDMSFNPIKIMRHAIEEANEKIHELAKEDAAKAGMGTTLVAVTVVGYYAYVANVGDSRLYVSDEQGLVQITRDHSWIAEMVMRGELSKEEARNHPDKNIITRAWNCICFLSGFQVLTENHRYFLNLIPIFRKLFFILQKRMVDWYSCNLLNLFKCHL